MAIRFKCANCGNAIVADDSAAGKRTSCPVCGIMVFLPRAQAPQEEDLSLAVEDPDSTRKMEEQLESENRAFNRLLMSSDDALENVKPGSSEDLDVFHIENLIVDWLTHTVQGEPEKAEAAGRKLRGRKQDVIPVLNQLDVTLLVDSPLADMPPPVLKKLKAQLLAEVEKPPSGK